MLFYERFKRTVFTDVPDIPFMYMEINNWQGMSVRCGVWQYYESGAFQDGKFERVLSFLKADGEDEMASVYARGIHDYANEKYQGNCDYPEEWLRDHPESDKECKALRFCGKCCDSWRLQGKGICHRMSALCERHCGKEKLL